jgi:hypothetical protein
MIIKTKLKITIFQKTMSLVDPTYYGITKRPTNSK